LTLPVIRIVLSLPLAIGPEHKKRPRVGGLGLRRWPASAGVIVKAVAAASQGNLSICAQF
jgi:hypothetical protein